MLDNEIKRNNITIIALFKLFIGDSSQDYKGAGNGINIGEKKMNIICRPFDHLPRKFC